MQVLSGLGVRAVRLARDDPTLAREPADAGIREGRPWRSPRSSTT
jgi:hypothetical protein